MKKETAKYSKKLKENQLKTSLFILEKIVSTKCLADLWKLLINLNIAIHFVKLVKLLAMGMVVQQPCLMGKVANFNYLLTKTFQEAANRNRIYKFLKASFMGQVRTEVEV